MQIDRSLLLPSPAAPLHAGPEVAILLALHNGGRFIQAQLDSLSRQSHRNWRLILGDDGSTDDGLQQVRDWGDRHPEHAIHLRPGPRRGFAQNFLSLLAAIGPQGGYAAFCDQDDVWLSERLSRGLDCLATVPDGQPALYCSRVLICDAGLGSAHPSALWQRPAGFAHALVQNIAPGNSFLLNPAAVRLAQAAQRRIGPVSAHDWWLYQLISGAGGRIICDTRPGLLYRQHGGNVIGANRGARALLRRGRILLSGELRGWIDLHLAALERVTPYLSPDNRALLAEFSALRRSRHWRQRGRWQRLGLYHQSVGSTALLHAALFTGLA